MAGREGGNHSTLVRRRVRTIVYGENDDRVRAIWRVLLAMPVLWVLTGAVLTGNVQSAVPAIPSGGETGGGLAQSVLHAAFFVVTLALWARYLDRRPLSAYGVSASGRWALDCALGFLAVLVGFGFWLVLGSALGATSVAVAPSILQGSILFGLALPFVALVLHAAVQQVVFFRVVLGAGVEGAHDRGVTASRAAVVGLVAAIVFFVLMHGSAAPFRIFDLVVAGMVFGLLFLHTGELGIGIGAHFGTLFGGIVVSGLLDATGSLPGVLGTVTQYGFPKLLVAYAVVLGVLWIQDRDIGIRAGVAAATRDSPDGDHGDDRFQREERRRSDS